MKTYDIADIKRIPIVRYLADVNIEVKNNRCAATWRNGDNQQAVSINADKNLFFDFVEGRGGTVIDLCMAVEGLAFADARRELATRYGIQQTDVPICAPAPKPPPQPDFIRVGWAVTNRDISQLDETDLPAAERVMQLVNGATGKDEVDKAISQAAAEFHNNETNGGSGLVLKSSDEIKADQRIDNAIHEWPGEVLRPQGLVGEVYDWIVGTAAQPQPKFALAAALVACGAMLGRGVKDYTGQRTNIFALALAASSGGKQHPFELVTKLVKSLMRDRLLAGEVTSDSALEVLLDAYPSRLLLLDEVGDYLGSIKSAGQANPFLKTVVPRLKTLWSSAKGIYVGKTRAPDNNGKWKPPKQLVEPHVAIYGTGAPSRLFDCMTERDFDDGSIPRFVAFISETMPMRTEKPEAVVPDNLRKRINDALLLLGIKAHSNMDDDGDNKAEVVQKARLVPESIGASAVFGEFEKFKHSMMQDAADDPPLYLWGKAVENARRIALTVACLRNPAKPEVEQYDAEYAVSLMRCSINEMIAYVRDHVAATERERNGKKVERIIRRAGAEGIEHSALTRRTQGMKDREDAIDDLIDGALIRVDFRNGTGKKKVRWYFHTRYLK